MKIGKPDYIKQAQGLSEEEQQKVMSRMSGKLPKRLFKDKLSVEEAIAIQLEIEEEQLADWRKNWAKIRKQDAEKKSGNVSKTAKKSAEPASQAEPKAGSPVSKSANKVTAVKASTGAAGIKAVSKPKTTNKTATGRAAASKAAPKS
jgi:hypothetical protein